jgi:hypothetical protein
MTDRQRKLIREDRRCVCCGEVAPYGKETPRGKMLSISTLLYRKGEGKGAIKIGRKINVCEPCLILACSSAIWGLQGAKLWPAMRERLSALYKSVIEGPAA